LTFIFKLVLSDPEKRKKYDKYGTLDEDDWDYQEFMKNFNFENIFNLFDESFLEGAFHDPNTMKHAIKLMLIRKEAEGDEDESEESYINQNSIEYKDGLPYFLYGTGNGLESAEKLMFWQNKEKLEDEWEVIEDKDTETKSKE
jgi:hypothetical protein